MKFLYSLLIPLILCHYGYGQVTFGAYSFNTDHSGVINSLEFNKIDNSYYAAGKTDSGSWSIIRVNFDGSNDWKLNDLLNNGSEISEITVDSEGNLYVIGYFFYKMRLPEDPSGSSFREFISNGGTDAFIASYTPDGELKWAKQYGKANQDLGMSIVILEDAIYTTALFQGDGTAIDWIGTLSSTSSTIGVLKFDLDGELDDLMYYTSSSNFIDLPNENAVFEVCQRVKADITSHDGALYIAGPFETDITPLNSSSILEAPTITTAVAGAPSIFITRLEPDLNHVWSTRVEHNRTGSDISGISISADCNGVYVGGGLDSNPHIGGGKTLSYFNPSSSSAFNFHRNYTLLMKFDLEDGAFNWINSAGYDNPLNSSMSTASYYDISADQNGLIWSTGSSNVNADGAGADGTYYLFNGSVETEHSFIDPLGYERNIIVTATNTQTGLFETGFRTGNAGDQGGYAINSTLHSGSNFAIYGGAINIAPPNSTSIMSLFEYSINDAGITANSCCTSSAAPDISSTTPYGGSLCYGDNISLHSDNVETTWLKKLPSSSWEVIGNGNNISHSAMVDSFRIVGVVIDDCGTYSSDTIQYTINTDAPTLTCTDQTISSGASCYINNSSIIDPVYLVPSCPMLFNLTSNAPDSLATGIHAITYDLEAEAIPSNATLYPIAPGSPSESFQFPFNSTAGDIRIGPTNTIIGSNSLGSNPINVDLSTTCDGSLCQTSSNVNTIDFTVDTGNGTVDYYVGTDEIINSSQSFKSLEVDAVNLHLNGDITIQIDGLLNNWGSIVVNGNVTIETSNIRMNNTTFIDVQSGSLILKVKNDVDLKPFAEMKSTSSAPLVALVKGNLRTRNMNVLEGLFYAESIIDIGNNGTYSGSFTAETIDVMGANNTITYSTVGQALLDMEIGSLIAIGPAPIIHGVSTSNTDTIYFEENGSFNIIDYAGTDDIDSEGSGLTYSLVSLGDEPHFSINSITGELKFNSPPDFENPLDIGGDNVYSLQIQLDDSEGNSDFQWLLIYVTDIVSNYESCDAMITVTENIDPIALCQDFTVNLDAMGVGALTVADIDGGSSDNCGIATLSASQTTFDCSSVLQASNDNSLYFDGINDYVRIAANPAYDFGTNDLISIETWIRASWSHRGMIFSYKTDDNNYIHGWLWENNKIYIEFGYGGSWQDVLISSSNITFGDWTHIAFTKSASDEWNLYINGVLDDTSTFPADLNIIPASSEFWLGVDHSSFSPTSSDFDGDIDEFRVWNNERTASQIWNNYNRTLFGDEIGLIGYFPFEDGASATTTTDLSSTANDGVLGSSAINYDPDWNSFGAASVTSVGPKEVTLTVIDSNGNSDACISNITVLDTISPSIICPGNIPIGVDAGECYATVSWTEPVGTDNCSNSTSLQTQGDPSGSTFLIGSHTIEYSIIDLGGNASTCSFDIVVTDDESPMADIPTLGDVSAECEVTALTAPTATDNCDGNLSGSTSTVFPITASTVVTWTYIDGAGNSLVQNQNVLVNDVTNPLLTCQDISVQLDGTGNVAISSVNVVSASSDNCSVPTLSLDVSSFDCSDVGANTVTVTATDASLNTATCTSIVTVEDNVNPSVSCQDISVNLDGLGNAGITPSDVVIISSDNCGVPSLGLDISSFDCTNIGANTVTITATDANTNTATCTSTVTIVDNTNPSVLCQNISVSLDGTGNASIVSGDIVTASSDNCGAPTLALDIASFVCTDSGANTVTVTATDANSNTATCTSTVTVLEAVVPSVTCQDFTAQLDGTGNVAISSVNIVSASSDNCSIPTLSLDVSSFDCSNVGANTVTVTATDASLNTATCTSTVTVEDNIDPTATCQDLTVNLDNDGEVTITLSDIDNGTNDACGISTMFISQSNFTHAELGINTVSLFVNDNNGNNSSCSSTVTVQDLTQPNALCQNIDLSLDATGNGSITSSDIDNGSTDNGSISSIDIDIDNFDCSNIGPNTVTLSVTDASSNVSTCTATVTVDDGIDPTVSCQDVTSQLDATGNLLITAADIVTASDDNCTTVALNLDISTFDCSNVGSNIVTVTASDTNGNDATCTSNVTIEDNINPNAICQNFNVSLDLQGDAMITVADINNGSFDACGIVSLSLSQENFTSSHLGTNSVELEVSDVNGNISTCSSTVTILDTSQPIALCQDITVLLDNTGSASITSSEINNGSIDNGTITSMTLDIENFDCTMLGNNTVTLTVTDEALNASTCSANVTVIDNELPTITCQDISASLDANGLVTIAAGDVVSTSNDNCGAPVLTLDVENFNCSDIGPNTVNAYATDVSGNEGTCVSIVHVEDDEAPTLICNDFTLSLDQDGLAQLDTTDVVSINTDNCTEPILTLNTSFDCSDEGTNPMMITSDDGSKLTTCVSLITVNLYQAPSISNQSFCSIENPVTENLLPNDGSIKWYNSALSALSAGQSLSTGTYYGRQITGDCESEPTMFTVEVYSTPNAPNFNPTAYFCAEDLPVLSDVTSLLIGFPIGSLLVYDAETGGNLLNDLSYEVSDGETFWISQTIGNCESPRTSVTVEFASSTEGPVAICTSETVIVNLDDSGFGSISFTDIDNGSFMPGSCYGMSTSLSDSIYDCSDINTTNFVTLNLIGSNGVSSSCNASIQIVDTISPEHETLGITVYLNEQGEVSVNATEVVDEDVSQDNCSTLTYDLSQTEFNCDNIGVNNIAVSGTDGSNNTTSVIVDIFVSDTIAPTPNLPVLQDIHAQCEVTLEPPTATDNCLGIIDGITNINTTITTQGLTVVTWEYSDSFNNTFSQTQNVYIEDTEAPEILNCPTSPIVFDNDQDQCGALVSFDVVMAEDLCNGVTMSTIQELNNTFLEVNTHTQIYTFSDDLGNLSTCEFDIIVQDMQSPEIVCPSDQIVSMEDNCEFDLLDYTNSYVSLEDNCLDEIDFNVEQSILGYPEMEEGLNTWNWDENVLTVELTANANNNESTSCSFVITLEQPILVVECPDDIIVENDIDECGAMVEIEMPTVQDDCNLNITNDLSLEPLTNEFFNVGVTEVQWTITAFTDRLETCVQSITVLDTQAPNLICPETTSQCATPVVENLLLGEEFYSDNCGFGAFPVTVSMTNMVQEYTVLWTVTDAAGNENTCSQTITDMEFVSVPDAGEDQVLNSVFTTELIGNIPEVGTVEWLSDANCIITNPASNSTIVTNLPEGESEFVYRVYEPGCTDLTDTVMVNVTEFFVPTGFSPNGDLVNDQLVIRGILAYPESKLVIFDRKGKKIYSAIGYENDWNGTGKKGSRLPKDTYFYVIEFSDGKSIKGSLEMKY